MLPTSSKGSRQGWAPVARTRLCLYEGRAQVAALPWGGDPSFSAIGAEGGGGLPTHPTSSGKILLLGGTDQLQTRNAGTVVAGPALEKLEGTTWGHGACEPLLTQKPCQVTPTEIPAWLRGQDTFPHLQSLRLARGRQPPQWTQQPSRSGISVSGGPVPSLGLLSSSCPAGQDQWRAGDAKIEWNFTRVEPWRL